MVLRDRDVPLTEVAIQFQHPASFTDRFRGEPSVAQILHLEASQQPKLLFERQLVWNQTDVLEHVSCIMWNAPLRPLPHPGDLAILPSVDPVRLADRHSPFDE